MKKIIYLSLFISINCFGQVSQLNVDWNATEGGAKILNKPTIVPLNSPTFTGTPTAPTAAVGTNTTQIATMEALQAHSSSGTYTPTLTNTGNLSASALINATYTRNGDIVTVVVGFTATPTAANTNTVLTLTLPIARSASTVLNIGSGALAYNAIHLSANLQTATNTTEVGVYFYPTTTNTYAGSATFMYSL